MFQRCKKYFPFFTIFLLLCVVVYIFHLEFNPRRVGLNFTMLDVGQGDAMLIESPSGVQIMWDGGGARRSLGPLAKAMPLFDRSIDALVVTNPDADHIAGFLDVLKNYKVKAFIEPGTLNTSQVYLDIKSEIKKQGILNLVAKKGMRLNLGGGVVIDILFPDRDVIDWSPNDGSMVARLVYGNTSIMLTGDASTKTEELIINGVEREHLLSTVLKVGHHGSRTSTSLDFIKAVAPAHALISSGRGNTYGHPHKEILNTLSLLGIETFRTDILGSIIMHSDGKNVTFSFGE